MINHNLYFVANIVSFRRKDYTVNEDDGKVDILLLFKGWPWSRTNITVQLTDTQISAISKSVKVALK